MSIHEVSNDEKTMPAGGSAPGFAATEDVPMQAENTQPSPASVPQHTRPTKTFFGLAQDARRQGFSQPVFNDDYVARFPEDPYGQETAPNARAYRVYVEEAAAFDENLVGQSRDGLDVMLVFAGLFSAVVTSFLVQVSQNLQADFSEMSALLLHDLVIIQLAMVDGATVNVTTPSINPTEKFDPDAIDVWINGLWVVSLVTSLVVALAAVLVKQWLHRYMTFPSGTPGLRSHIRQFRFMGLEKWRIRIIIGMLPIIMHISLMLFFAGLTLFFIPLHVSLAWTVGTLTVLVCVLYLVSNTIPIVFPQCPYQTPLTDFIHHICQVVRFGIQSMRQLWRKTVHTCFVACRSIRELAISSEQQSLRDSDRSLSAASEVLQYLSKSLTQLESAAVQDAHYTLSVDALDWLYHMSSNPIVHFVVLQGISGLPAESRSYAVTKWSGTNMRQLVREALSSLDFHGQPWVVERFCRSYLFLPQVNIERRPTLQSILIDESCDLGPHIRAAAWIAYGPGPFFDYHGFFSSHSEVLMHPLIWEEIVDFMLDSSHYPETDECSLAQVLSIVIGPPPATSPSASLMTGTQVIWTRLQPRIWDRILKWPLLAPYDSVPVGSISSYHRTLISTGKLALSHVLRHRDNMDHFTIAHLKLLAFVVGLITDPHVTPNAAHWTVDIDFLCSVVQELRDVSSSSILVESHNDSNLLLLCVSKLRSFYHRSSFMSKFHFPSLEFLLQTWASFHNCIQYASGYERNHSSDLWLLTDIMGSALSRGYEEAYRIFRDEGWMAIIFTEWAIGDNITDTALSRVIGCYIMGLDNLTLNSNRREFCEYLHQPQQLALCFMLIMVADEGPYDFSSSLRILVKICPTHTSWRDCDTAMKAILAWAQRPNPEIPLFPWPPCLQKLCTDLGTDCTTAAFRKYSLVECTAHKFSLQHMRNQLEAGLEILHTILENTEHVEGV